MAITGLLSGFNEQRAATGNYLAQLDQMRRAQVAQQMELGRIEEQRNQYAQEMAMRQQQAERAASIDQARMAQQAQQHAQEFGLRSDEFGLRKQSELGRMNREEQARNALRDVMAAGGETDMASLARAVLPYDPNTGIGLIRAGREEQRQQALLDRTGGTGVNAPQGYRWTQDGNLEAIPGGGADPMVLAQMERIKNTNREPKPLTETQGNAVGFGMRAQEAQRQIEDLANQGVMTGSLIKQGVESLPLIGGALGMAANALVASPEQQQVEQAQRNFVNALLRKESGAAISPGEFDNARRQYFAQPGDSPQVLEQKRANRETAINALRVQAGPGAANIQGGEPSQPSSWQDSYKSQAQAVQDALEAVRKGAPREAVRERLKQIGITDARL